jgi:hypothetical protein
MRLATLYYMAQVSSRRTHRETQPDAPPDTPRRGRHARPRRRGHPERGLPAFARRILAMRNGTSQAA